jgi:hypothetical protein
MNQNFKKVMDLLSEIKGAFHKKEASNFEQATLVDGVTVIEYEALEVGMPVFVVVDAEGIITEIIDTREEVQSAADQGDEQPEDFEAISAEQLPAVLEQVTEVIAEQLGLEMDRAYDVASAVVNKINEATEMDASSEFSATDVENIINARLESFSQAVEGLAEMTKAIAESNTQLVNELSSLKSEFETFKAQPSVETRENEKFSKVGNLTTRQAFLLKNK